jgi:hypothetical protein
MSFVLAATLVVTGLTLTAPSVQARADYSSFFEGQPRLSGAGWAACVVPVTWSVDVRWLDPPVARREIRRLKRAWAIWSQASAIPVQFTGRERLEFDPGTNGLRRTDWSPHPPRHVYLAFKTARQVPIMTRGVIGLAMPSIVLLPTREIVGGMSIFRRGYVVKERIANPKRVIHLYLHEIGHILGLGHARRDINVMYPSLDTMVGLGPGDRAGVAAITQECTW